MSPFETDSMSPFDTEVTDVEPKKNAPTIAVSVVAKEIKEGWEDVRANPVAFVKVRLFRIEEPRFEKAEPGTAKVGGGKRQRHKVDEAFTDKDGHCSFTAKQGVRYAAECSLFGIKANPDPKYHVVTAGAPGESIEVKLTVPLSLRVKPMVIKEGKQTQIDEVPSGTPLIWKAEPSQVIAAPVTYKWTFTGCSPAEPLTEQNSDIVHVTTAGHIGRVSATVTIIDANPR
jgi:hypothetical protein